MSEQATPRYGIDPYLDWVAKEGLKVHEGYYAYLIGVETRPWARVGVDAAVCHLKGRGDFATLFVFDIPPGGSTAPQKHLYEEVCYVLEGSGSTQLEMPDGTKRSFEWGPRSMFAIPLNVKYRHFNASGVKRARFSSTTDLPMKLNAFVDENFIFNNDYAFEARIGKDIYYAGQGDLHMVRPGNHMWETNFVPDLDALELHAWSERGGNSTNIMFVLANGIMHAHISEMPVGTYKKAHKHHNGVHVMCVSGSGYSLLWLDGEKDFRRIDWEHGMVFPPANQQFHQHFNTSKRPARYFATAVGGIRYPFTEGMRRASGGSVDGRGTNIVATSTSVKLGGDQIEYEDQDPRIHEMFLEACRKNGVEQKMDKFFPARQAAQ
jgi:quercetin dioxygenase-like cupin family protein